MFRAILELLVTILIVMVARAVLTGLLRGVANASQNAFRNQSNPAGTSGSSGDAQAASGPKANQRSAGELHRDPVCGTYVPESTDFQARIAGQSYYYCSAACREKHSLVAR